jgi:3-dehydroquinate synthase
MEEVKVSLPAGGYTIHIGQEALSETGRFLSRLGLGERALVVTDANVAPLYGARLADILARAGITAETVAVDPGESAKSLAVAEKLYSAAITGRLDRRSPVIALGGGVVGDLAGFVAATYQRGVPFVQLPTTLLAQVDSSVGGKVAVNHPLGKNLIGAFYQPRLVVADTAVLATLPARELIAGLAEVAKYGVIADAAFFAYLSDNHAAALAGDNSVLAALVSRSCSLKAQVVEQDERETGLRMILNFGHTIGHAVEAAAGFSRYRHGEAVAIGMHAAALLSCRLGFCDDATVTAIADLLGCLGLPITAAGCRPDEMMAYLARDKKSVGGKINWVLVEKIGQVTISDNVPDNEIRRVLADITAGES